MTKISYTKSLIFIVTAMTGQAAYAEEDDRWIQYGVMKIQNSTVDVYADLKSMDIEGRNAIIWTKAVADKPINGDIKEFKSRYIFDCDNRRQASTDFIKYDVYGKILGSSYNQKEEWTRIVPDSMAEGLFDAVCDPIIKNTK